MSDPQQPHGLQPSKLFCPWDLPSKSTGVGCHCLLLCIWGTVNSSEWMIWGTAEKTGIEDERGDWKGKRGYDYERSGTMLRSLELILRIIRNH